MITLAPSCTMPEEMLSDSQQSALTSLVLGKTVSEAAGEAGVHRNTVHRWLKEDETFQKAKGHLQHDAQRAVEAKLHDTAVLAMECIEQCLQEGDTYVAEQLLKGLGCSSGELKSLGSEDAVELAQEALHHSAIAEMLGGSRSEVGDRKSAQAEGEDLQPSATSDGRSRHSVPDDYSVDNQPASGTECHDLREMERYASVFTKSDEAEPGEENQQHTATSDHGPELPEPRGYAELTSQQTFAMFALLTGQTIAEAAESAETEPATVYQWVKGDHTFQAAMNRCARERRQAIQARLTQLASLAADVVHHRIRHGNGHLAVRLLKGLGYLKGRK